MIEIGDEVLTKPGLYHYGSDVGNRLGTVIDTKSHIIVELYEYEHGPIKCFTHELEVLQSREEQSYPLEELEFDFDLNLDPFII